MIIVQSKNFYKTLVKRKLEFSSKQTNKSKLHDEIISKAKGFISWEHYLQGEIWTDFVLWETEEDANRATTIGKGKEVTNDFYACIHFEQIN